MAELASHLDREGGMMTTNNLYIITTDESTLIRAVSALYDRADELITTPVQGAAALAAAKELQDAMDTAKATGNTLPLDEPDDQPLTPWLLDSLAASELGDLR
jgi:hypothetical protein